MACLERWVVSLSLFAVELNRLPLGVCILPRSHSDA